MLLGLRHNDALQVIAEATRSYLPLESPVGFGAADWIVVSLALIGLLAIAALRPRHHHLSSLVLRTETLLASRGPWFFFALTLALRLLLLSTHPTPIPSGADDFSYLLLGDTFAHGRWTNAPLLHPSFFETVFVLQQPTYSSIFPPAQGLALAAGQWVFGVPWIGVLLSISLLAAACHWMLSGWLCPRWAAAGGFLAVFSFGPLCSWMNCYWGGAMAAIAGCIVFGSLARLRQSPRTAFAITAGLGFSLHLLARPYETILLALSIIMFWALFLRETRQFKQFKWRNALSFGIACLPGLVVLLVHSHAVTHDWTKLPYMLSREQVGVPTTFTFQSNPIPTHTLTQAQKNDYDAQSAVHGDRPESMARFFSRLFYRLRFLRFFVFAPLYLPALFCFWRGRDKVVLWAAGTLLLFIVGTNIYPYFYAHYIAGLCSVFLLIVLTGLRMLRNTRLGKRSAIWLIALCAFQFVFWYLIQASGSSALIRGMGRFETWDYLNFGDPQGRLPIDSQLRDSPGTQLVFIRYSANHGFEEWLANDADIGGSRVVRALDLSPTTNLALISEFQHRKVWLLRPDARPPQLTPYPYAVNDMMVIPKASQAAPQARPVKRNPNKLSDWLEEVK